MKRTASKGLASFIGAATSLFIASELYRDVLWRTQHFVAPRTVKLLVMVALLWVAMQEASKVHGRLEELLGGV